MILSGAMMLDWLGLKNGVPAMCEDGAKLREAVDAQVAARADVTPDLGGSASTTQAAQAVQKALRC